MLAGPLASCMHCRGKQQRAWPREEGTDPWGCPLTSTQCCLICPRPTHTPNTKCHKTDKTAEHFWEIHVFISDNQYTTQDPYSLSPGTLGQNHFSVAIEYNLPPQALPYFTVHSKCHVYHENFLLNQSLLASYWLRFSSLCLQQSYSAFIVNTV